MTTTAMRFFNTAGPIDAEIHYHIPPLARLDVDDLLLLIQQRKYFVLHAPRQTGKTSALLALKDDLNASGEFRCAYVNVEIGQAAREDVAAAMRLVRGAFHDKAYRLRPGGRFAVLRCGAARFAVGDGTGPL